MEKKRIKTMDATDILTQTTLPEFTNSKTYFKMMAKTAQHKDVQSANKIPVLCLFIIIFSFTFVGS